MKAIGDKVRQYAIPSVLCIAIGVVYYITTPQSLILGDSGSLISSAYTFGVNIPPAPVFVFLAHFFSILPTGNTLLNLKVFSLIISVSTLFLLFLLTKQIANQLNLSEKKRMFTQKNIVLVSSFGLFSLAFSYQFWSQAETIERFIPTCLLELLVFILLIKLISADLNKKNNFLLLVGIFLLLGISTGVDPVVVSFFPPAALLLWLQRSSLNKKKLLLLVLAGAAGIVIAFSYLPIASLFNPFINYHRPTGLKGIYEAMTEPTLNKNLEATGGDSQGFTASASVFFRSFGYYFSMIWTSFTPFLLPFMIMGGIFLWDKERKVFLILISTLIGNLLLSCLYLSGNQESWFLLSHAVLAILCSFGFLWLLLNMKKFKFAPLFGLIAVIPLLNWWHTLDRHQWSITEDYITNMYRPINKPAILIGYGDFFVGTTNYAYTIQHKSQITPLVINMFGTMQTYRQNLASTSQIIMPSDTQLLAASNAKEYRMNFSKVLNDLVGANIKRSKIYITNSALKSSFVRSPENSNLSTFTLDTNRFKLVPAGLVQQIVPKDQDVTINLHNFDYLWGNDYPASEPIYFEQYYKDQMDEIRSEYAYSYGTLGDYFIQHGHAREALESYSKVLDINPKNTYVLNQLAVYYAGKNDNEKALDYMTKAHESQPDNPQYLYNMAILNMKKGENDVAKNLLLEALHLASNNEYMTNQINNALHYMGN